MTDTQPQWELIADDCDSYLHRIRVPGGWLYQNLTIFDKNVSESMVFVPDNGEEKLT